MVELLDTYGVLHIGTTIFYFDLDDLSVIESRTWYVDKDGYLTSSYYYLGQIRIVRFHRIVTHAKPGQWVDHMDKKGLFKNLTIDEIIKLYLRTKTV